MRRRTLALILGVALPAVLLGAGWLAASIRHRAAAEGERRAALARVADVVRGAVDESLEELRRREDSRPFYVYNPYFSPPDVLAISDPVVSSPLAQAPDDPRLVGYFQVGPDASVLTPYDEGPSSTIAKGRAQKVVTLVESEPFASIRELAHYVDSETPDPTASAVARGNGSAEIPVVASVDPSLRRGTEAAPGRWQGQASAGRRPPGTDESPSSRPGPGGPGSQLGPQGPLTLSLNQWGVELYNDIQAAQTGSTADNMVILQRGRQVPVTRRNPMSWDQVESQVRAQQRRRGSSGGNKSPVARRGGGNKNLGLLQGAPLPMAGPVGPAPREVPSRGTEVDYTPMAWRLVEGSLVLHRVVIHQNAAVLQGVVLDRRHLVESWLPALVRRHSVASEAPAIIEPGDDASCELRRPASSVLEGVDLCFSAAALAPGAARLDLELYLQLGALGGLILIVALAGLVIHRAARRAEELSAQKSAFVSAVSHELRTPLTTIRMYSEMLREGLVSEVRRDQFHRDLVHESVRLSHLVENVLELVRLEEGRRMLKARPGDLRQLVAEVIEQQRPFIEAKGFELVGPRSDEADQADLEVAFDGQAISQIVVNLLDNAVKYAASGAVRAIEVDVEARLDEAAAVIRVLDRGPGVPASERGRVFERFYRIDRPGEAHMPGTGIGLSLVRDLAQAHGGDAEVLSRPGGGCEARVVLPVLTGETASGSQ